MSAFGSVGVGLLGVFLALILRESGFKGAKLFSVVAMVVVLLSLTEGIDKLSELIGDAARLSGASDAASTVFRLVGVSYVFGIGAEMCRELGEAGIASAVLTAGRVELFLIGAPYLTRIFELARELLGEG